PRDDSELCPTSRPPGPAGVVSTGEFRGAALTLLAGRPPCRPTGKAPVPPETRAGRQALGRQAGRGPGHGESNTATWARGLGPVDSGTVRSPNRSERRGPDRDRSCGRGGLRIGPLPGRPRPGRLARQPRTRPPSALARTSPSAFAARTRPRTVVASTRPPPRRGPASARPCLSDHSDSDRGVIRKTRPSPAGPARCG